MLSEQNQEILTRYRVELVQSINLEGSLWDELITRRVLTMEDKDNIEALNYMLIFNFK